MKDEGRRRRGENLGQTHDALKGCGRRGYKGRRNGRKANIRPSGSGGSETALALFLVSAPYSANPNKTEPRAQGAASEDLEVTCAVRLPEEFSEEVIPYLPGGIQQITPVKGPREVWVQVDAASASVMEAHRKAVEEERGKRSYFDFNHQNLEASFWPREFFWDANMPVPGTNERGMVCARGEYSASGKAAVKGRDWREFSPKCWLTPGGASKSSPARVAMKRSGNLNLGGFVNDGAFMGTELWSGHKQSNENQNMNETEIAALRQKNTELETEITALRAKVAADDKDELSKARLEAAQANLKAGQAQVELEAASARATKAETLVTAENKIKADAAIDRAKKRAAIPLQGEKAKEIEAHWRSVIDQDSKNIVLLDSLPGNEIAASRITSGQPQRRVEGGFSAKGALQAYAEILARNTIKLGGSRRLDKQMLEDRRLVAIEAANFYATELEPHFKEFAGMPINEIEAADNTDANLGTLSGTLVLQRSLPLFKYDFPVLNSLYTDFSATPGSFNQTEDTRVIVVPAVQTFDNTTDATGRPKGWSTVNAAQTTDVPIKLDTYVGIPIVFSQTQLASTIRRLFDEQGPAAIYAMAKYFVMKVSNLITPANFNAYAAVTAADAQGIVRVPVAYATYAVAQKNFNVGTLDQIGAIMDQNEVPGTDRAVLLNSQYYAQERQDPRLSLFYAALADREILTKGRLPELNGFMPHKAPYLAPANNLVGFAFHKAALVLKQRLPTDWTQALGVMIPGSVTTVVDPESGLACLLVQYVNMQGGFAEWRLETFIGAAVGDKRGGLCITSQ